MGRCIGQGREEASLEDLEVKGHLELQLQAEDGDQARTPCQGAWGSDPWPGRG